MFNRKSPEEIAEKEAAEKQEKLKRQIEKRQRIFNASPQGQARKAFENGSTLFQIDLTFSETSAVVRAMEKAKTDERTFNNSETLEKIESEGWQIDHVGYVFKMLGSVSRDKFMSSGQQESVTGEIVGIYIFRRKESNKKIAD